MKKDNIQFRIIYFIAIFMIVAGHTGSTYGVNLFYDWFKPYSFHLAIFIFCSGYFFVHNKDKKIFEIILNKIKK